MKCSNDNKDKDWDEVRKWEAFRNCYRRTFRNLVITSNTTQVRRALEMRRYGVGRQISQIGPTNDVAWDIFQRGRTLNIKCSIDVWTTEGQSDPVCSAGAPQFVWYRQDVKGGCALACARSHAKEPEGCPQVEKALWYYLGPLVQRIHLYFKHVHNFILLV